VRLDEFAQTKLRGLENRGLARTPATTTRHGVQVTRQGRPLISFCCNDYLGLAHDPRVLAAAKEAAEQGAGAGAARLVTGGHPGIEEFENRIATFLGREASVSFGSGFLTNLGVIPSLVGPGDRICIDALAHASLWAGAKLSGAEVLAYGHNDLQALRDHLKQPLRGQSLILTEGVFSMDGDLAPLPALIQLASEFEAWLLVDDAHGLGVLNQGKGAADLDIPLLVGTCSKALGSYGGFVTTSKNVAKLLHARARSFVYTTALPPMVVAASLAALAVVAAEPERTLRPLARALQFTRLLGLPLAQSAIVPWIVGSPERALAAQR